MLGTTQNTSSYLDVCFYLTFKKALDMLGTTQNTSSYLDVCFSMAPFRGQFKLQPHPHWSPLGGLILVF